ncbi:MAG: RHS repeat domain-containing protein [Mangrovibacterium sp.]
MSGEPDLFAGRGFTAHEHLEDFNLVNMNGRLYDPVVSRFLSPDPIVQAPDFTQGFNRYSYCLNNPLKYNDPNGEFWWLLPVVWIGNYAINWLDNTINKGMSPKEVFQQTPITAGINFSPSTQTFSHPQIEAYQAAQHQEVVAQQLNEFEASMSGFGRNMGEWFSNHFIAETEFRIDQGIQFQIQGKVLGLKVGLSGEKETEPIAQLNWGYSGAFYGYEYAFDNPSYGYGGIIDPIRTGWSAALIGGASQSYYPHPNIFKVGPLKSEAIHYGLFNITKTYGYDGRVLEKQYTFDFGIDIALFLGISTQLRIGYKQ